MQDKASILEKIVSSPETLSDDDIRVISGDEDLIDMYECAARMSRALTDVPEFDTDASLRQIHGMMHSQKPAGFSRRLVMGLPRRAAAAIAIGLSLTAFAVLATIHFMPKGDDAPDSPETYAPAPATKTEASATPVKSDKLYYDDTPLSDILSDVCARYQCNVAYADSAVLTSRFHLSIPAEASLQEAVSIINAFDEVRIYVRDNTIVVE